jgi:hypothetical protein
MGLDIIAYSNLHPVGTHTERWCNNEDHVVAFAYADFTQSFRGIPILSTSTAGSGVDIIEGGCYERTEHTKDIGFQAGSYGGYGRWRDDLRCRFNPETAPDGPFYELIYFADNEGSIGPDAARDLLADFREHAARYPLGLSEYSRERYSLWTQACELAADHGLIYFS